MFLGIRLIKVIVSSLKVALSFKSSDKSLNSALVGIESPYKSHMAPSGKASWPPLACGNFSARSGIVYPLNVIP